MSYREIPPLREGSEVVTEALKDALDRTENEPLPTLARLNRIQNNVLAQIASANRTRSSDDEMREAPFEEAHLPLKRPSKKAHIRYASAKIGLAALIGMGAAWSSVTGYRAYFENAPIAQTALPPTSHANPMFSTRRSGAPIDEPSRPPEESSPISDEKPAPTSQVALVGHTAQAPIVAPSTPPAKIAAAPPANSTPLTIAQRPAIETAAPEPLPTPEPAGAQALPELEEDLLERARQALRSDPQTALAIADTHRRSYAVGRLSQEREVIAIQALTKLKRFGAARARAVLFLSEHPESPYANDVRAMATTSLR